MSRMPSQTLPQSGSSTARHGDSPKLREQDDKIYFAAEGSAFPFVIRLRHDAEKKTDLIGFSANSRADVDALFAQAVAAGAKPISVPAPTEGAARPAAMLRDSSISTVARSRWSAKSNSAPRAR